MEEEEGGRGREEGQKDRRDREGGWSNINSSKPFQHNLGTGHMSTYHTNPLKHVRKREIGNMNIVRS